MNATCPTPTSCRVQRHRPGSQADQDCQKRALGITATRAAGADAQVITRTSAGGAYRRQPCEECPWRTDAVGQWPAAAFVHSANTAADMSSHLFGCHTSARNARAATCAGFLLAGAQHNLSVRLAVVAGRIDLEAVSDGGTELFEDYSAMAIANGVRAEHPALAACRRARR